MPYLAINFTNISPDSYWDSASMPFFFFTKMERQVKEQNTIHKEALTLTAILHILNSKSLRLCLSPGKRVS